MTIVGHPRVILEEWPALARPAQKSPVALQFERRRHYGTESGKARSRPGNDGPPRDLHRRAWWRCSLREEGAIELRPVKPGLGQGGME